MAEQAICIIDKDIDIIETLVLSRDKHPGPELPELLLGVKI